ncbi:hypothetical protein DRJ48_00925 [Candidatus Woesearchaeota archaeon]|nr:undecaprenyl diphosphate synthase family protein [Candidatus Woesearchaeota archaeon]RLE43434.1 MAG: hypothetical protein DRJ48_00925 [Candidatus Woesearchaeota archaeon]
MLDHLSKILQGKKRDISKIITHIAITLEGQNLDNEYLEKLGLTPEGLYLKKAKLLNELSVAQVRLGVPILTIFLLSSRKLGTGFPLQVKHLKTILDGLRLEFLHKNQVKVSFIGKWYELPSDAVDKIKQLLDETRDYDRYFLNLCVYYDGQAEIVDACQMIARRVERQRVSPEEITKQTIKDNLYTSQYPAPNLIIVNDSNALQGFLLWDASDSKIIFTNKPWLEFSPQEFKKLLEQGL